MSSTIDKASNTPPTRAQAPRESAEAASSSKFTFPAVLSAVASGAVLIGVVWLFWQDLLAMQLKWESDPQYSHGYLVPIIAGFLLWTRRAAFRPAGWNASWWGVVLLALGLAAKICASYYYIESLDHLSLILVLTAAIVAIWGRGGIKWAAPGVLFLVFMLPLPYTLETAMQGPLRSVGTLCSTFLLQTLGLPAFNEGYVIRIGEQSIGVVEACSGIRMLMVFFALSTAVALMIGESWPVKLGLIVSAIPIAVLANVMRIASTAAMYYFLSDATVFGMPGTEFAGKFFHDWAGWFMIPMALLMLWVELWLLDRLVINVIDRPLVAEINADVPSVSTHVKSPVRSDVHK